VRQHILITEQELKSRQARSKDDARETAASPTCRRAKRRAGDSALDGRPDGRGMVLKPAVKYQDVAHKYRPPDNH